MSAETLIFIAVGANLVLTGALLAAFGWLVRGRLARSIRSAELRINHQLHDDGRGLRPRLEQLERETAALAQSLRLLQRASEREIEKHRRASHDLLQIARGLTRTAILNEDRVGDLARRAAETAAESPPKPEAGEP